MSTPSYGFIDTDEHSYDPDDCFTRHLDERFRDRGYELKPVGSGGHRMFFFEGQPALPHFYDGIMPPGYWKSVMAPDGKGAWTEDASAAVASADHPDYRDRDARLEWMDAHNIEATLINSTLSADLLAASGDMPLLYAHTEAFNRYLEDDWGYRYKNRIFTVANLSLDDRELAIAELERLIRQDVKFVSLAPRNHGNRSPGDPYFDPFWERLVEADVHLVAHLGSGLGYEQTSNWSERLVKGEDVAPEAGGGTQEYGAPSLSAFQSLTTYIDRPIMDFLSAMILHNLFGRVPGLRILSVENGVGWVPYLLRQLDKSYRQCYENEWIGGRPDDLPSEIFKRHVSLAPFFGDPIAEVMNVLGPGNLMLGSDYPHPEGVAEPAEFLGQLAGYSEEVVRGYMRSTAAGLFGLPA